MPNERNVEALELVIVAQLGKSRTMREQAEFLASRGCLVPSALTDEDIHGLWNAASLPLALERIAKGES